MRPVANAAGCCGAAAGGVAAGAEMGFGGSEISFPGVRWGQGWRWGGGVIEVQSLSCGGRFYW